MCYLRLYALLTLVRSFTLFGGWGKGGEGGLGKANKVNYERWCANGEWSEIYQPPAKFEHFAKKYSLTTNKFLKATQEQSTQSGSLISDVCCYSQPPFSKLIHTMGGGRSPDHGSLPVAENECLWPRVSYMKAGDFLACEQAHWCVWCRTRFLSGARGSAGTNFLQTLTSEAARTFYAGPVDGVACVLVIFGLNRLRGRRHALICISVFILCLVPSFLAVSPLYSASKSLHFIL